MQRTGLAAFAVFLILLFLGSGYIAWQSRVISDLRDEVRQPEIITIHDTVIQVVSETLTLPNDTIEIVRERTVRDTLNNVLTIYDTIYAPIDTYAVVKDYYLKRVQKDTILQADVLAYITDTVYMNRILTREVILQNQRELSKVSNVWKVYAGGYGGTNGTQFTAGIGLLATPKRDNFAFGYLFDATRQTHNFAIFGKISFRK
jgi:hypothetical protein